MKKKILVGILVALSAFIGAATVPTQTVSAAPSATCSSHFMGLKAWYDGLTEGGSCEILGPEKVFPSENHDNAVKRYIWTVILNIVSMVLGIIGYLAIGFVMWGGIQYIMAQGDVGKVARGKKTVTNSIIGIIIVMTASIISGAVADIINTARDKDEDFFLEIFNNICLWGGIIAAIMIVWGGIQYIMSTGNPAGIAKAKNTILFSAIGLLIIVFAATIINTVVGAV